MYDSQSREMDEDNDQPDSTPGEDYGSPQHSPSLARTKTSSTSGKGRTLEERGGQNARRNGRLDDNSRICSDKKK